ncbi:MAG: hypothetical protein QOE90_2658 [Thermoplasmata archaeon]|jgi:hypothetical protein|nr:hypothetical protein [Thermoplasmata archaeon]
MNTTRIVLVACLALALSAPLAAAVPGLDPCTGLVARNCTCRENTTNCPAGDPCYLYADQECWVGSVNHH